MPAARRLISIRASCRSVPKWDAALVALKDKPYTAIPSWKNDGTWELWTMEGDGETEPFVISGPSTTYPSEADALAAGAAWIASLNSIPR